eukprot:6451987-Lingulodinium_polyedra.AAC.1
MPSPITDLDQGIALVKGWKPDHHLLMNATTGEVQNIFGKAALKWHQHGYASLVRPDTENWLKNFFMHKAAMSKKGIFVEFKEPGKDAVTKWHNKLEVEYQVKYMNLHVVLKDQKTTLGLKVMRSSLLHHWAKRLWWQPRDVQETSLTC